MLWWRWMWYLPNQPERRGYGTTFPSRVLNVGLCASEDSSRTWDQALEGGLSQADRPSVAAQVPRDGGAHLLPRVLHAPGSGVRLRGALEVRGLPW
eukprot:1195894-Rhodomonas_salina.1